MLLFSPIGFLTYHFMVHKNGTALVVCGELTLQNPGPSRNSCFEPPFLLRRVDRRVERRVDETGNYGAEKQCQLV